MKQEIYELSGVTGPFDVYNYITIVKEELELYIK